jgi:hypothetical protein
MSTDGTKLRTRECVFFLLIKKTELMMIKGKREKKQAGFDGR